jgi:phenylacetate-CoA ligase
MALPQEMGIDFRIKDFAYPFSILKLKREFDRNQRLSEETLRQYQAAKLRQILTHAYNTVPYYRKLFKENDILPVDIQSVEDLRMIPFLTKDSLRLNFDSLVARSARKYKPKLLSTSGTTGGKVNFYVDKPSNVLEFVYYWRFWNWAGYRLGDTFAELETESFLFLKKRSTLHHFNHLTRRLALNSALMSSRYLDKFIGLFKKFKPLFLKGLSVNLYTLALLFRQKRNHGISFKAIFSCGSNLLRYQRDTIEEVFSSKVFDSYGHMERTVAISQCPSGSYHIHSDYGIAELEEPAIHLENAGNKQTCVREIIGTSLHNFTMPLIRYRTGDFVEVNSCPQKCACKRSFPTIVSVIGRKTDVIITPDRRAVAGSSLIFNHTPGIVMGQIIQEDISQLLIKIVPASEDAGLTDKILMGNIRYFVGDDMNIRIEHTTIEGIRKDSLGKFKAIISNIPHDCFLS